MLFAHRVCYGSLTGSHLLYEAFPREGGREGGPLQEEEGPAPGVPVEHSLQGLPARGGERQALHEGDNTDKASFWEPIYSMYNIYEWNLCGSIMDVV